MTVLASDRSHYWPPTFEQTAEGNTFIFNGLDDALRVRRYDSPATVAGIEAPVTACSMSFSGTGDIDGDYYAYVRFVDQDGIPSNLSPISALATATDNQTVHYTGIPVSSNSRVTTREVYRNTDGQTIVFYLDVTLSDNTTTNATSTKTDTDLQASTALPILNADGSLNANRFTPPPAHKAVVVQHQDRLWFAVDVAYQQGNITVVNGDATVTGVGTEWKENWDGRFLHIPRAGFFEIASVNETAQTLELTEAWSLASTGYGYYSILPDPDERNKIYFSYPGEPESVPALNSFKIQEIGGDELTGLMPLGQFLFPLMRRHVYRVSFGISPNDDLAVHKTVSRGCVNQRCWVRVEDVAYLMDREGVHRFEGGHDGGRTEHVSEQVQDYFRDGKINWAAERFFFASHNPTEEVIRFHVAMGGNYLPKHALCYHYRHQAWWVEDYPLAFGGTCLPMVNGKQRCLLGSEYDSHYFQNDGTLDVVQKISDATTYRAYADSATLTSLTDNDATYPAEGVVNAPLSIIQGKGKGQTNRIVSVDGQRLNLRNPWRILPDTTSVYQIGAIQWRTVGGTYRFVQEHQADQFQNMNLRRVYMACEPTQEQGHIDLRLFIDHNPDPKSDYVKYDGDDGVHTLDSDAYIVLDTTFVQESPAQGTFSGYRQFDVSQQLVDPRFSANWITPELSGYQGRDQVILYTLGVGGAQ